ncbi:quinon protein alcohol dehydrogenase-like superfamily [Rhizopus microsporus]
MSFDQINTTKAENNETIKNIKDNNDLENTTEQHDLPKPKKSKQRSSDPNASCYIHQLSIEVVTHIFARLDPVSLATVAKVCHYWRHIVNNDVCWRDAFISYFGRLPYKRLSLESWKTEYILRTHLIRKWTKSRGPVISFAPKIGSLESMYVDFEDASMIVASSEQGVAAKCNPMTGKIDRHLLYSTNEAIPLHVTATKVEKDRIAWGFQPGYITLLVRTKRSGHVANRLKVFSDFHQGPVRILVLPSTNQDIVLSGADDGQIKIWDVASLSCAWTLAGPSAVAKPTCLEVTNDQRIIAGYSDGTVIIWNINLNHILQISRSQRSENYQQAYAELYQKIEENKRVISPPRSCGIVTPVQSMLYDSETSMIIVAYNGRTEVKKFNVNTGLCTASFNDGHFVGTTITCMQWDTSPSYLSTLDEALKPHPDSKKKANIIHLTSPKSSGQNTPLSTSVSTKATRLLVTGDDLGVICLWNGDEVSKDGQTIKPIQILSGGHTVAISSIYVDAFKIVTGSDDGWIRMWDPLTGTNIHTLGNKIPKNAPIDRTDVDVMRVKNIWCNEYQGVATIGHQVKTWDFSPRKQLLNKKQLKPKGKFGNGNARDKYRYEIDQEVKDSIKKLEDEKKERQRHEMKLSKLTLEGLSDEEMLHYALMLSQDTSAPDVAPQPSITHDDYVDDDEELLKAVIASLNVDQDTNEKSSFVGSSNASNHSDAGSSDRDEWISATEFETTNLAATHEKNEIDKDLLYVLELSKTDK